MVGRLSGQGCSKQSLTQALHITKDWELDGVRLYHQKSAITSASES